MGTIQTAWEFAQLAQAAYVDIGSKLEGNVEDALRASANNLDKIFSSEQAQRLIGGPTGYSVADISANKNDAVGFSATLFRSNADGNYVLAIRGTEPGIVDAEFSIRQIADWGVAANQIVSLYNYFQRLITPSGELAQQYALTRHLVPPAMAYATMNGKLTPDAYLTVDTYYAPAIGTLADLGPGVKVTVTGHSLGGHLAQALLWLFPGWVGEVYAHNTAGFDPANITAFLQYLDWSANVGRTPAIHNIYSYNGGEYITNDLVHEQYGIREGILIEDQRPTLTGNHSIVLQARSLALHALFEQIDAAFDEGAVVMPPPNTPYYSNIDTLIRAAAWNQPSTYESTLQAFVKLYLNQTLSVAALEPLETFYDKLFAVRDAIGPASPAKIVALTDMDASALDANAYAEVAYRYSLRHLIPFALVGNDALFAQHNTRGELDIFNPATQRGDLSSQWLSDRADMLPYVAKYNIADGNITFRGDSIETYFYENRRSATESDVPIIVVGKQTQSVSTPVKIVFGSDNADTIIGGDVVVGDHLYGAAGNDSLVGNGGTDYLEGGRGSDTLDGGIDDDMLIGGADDDILRGGMGLDTYIVGQGQDRIDDSDGLGLVMDGTGRHIAGLFLKSGSQYVSATDPTLVATLNSPLTIQLPNNASVVVDGFTDGELGIRLVQQMAQAAAPGNTKTGTPGANYLLAAAGGSLLDGQGAGDYLAGGAGNDRLLGGDGVDYLSGNLGANWSEGGAGGDVIILGAGAGYANGGDGDDLIAYFGADIYPPETIARSQYSAIPRQI